MRLIATLGQYLATTDASGVQIHQYAPATLSTADFALRIESNYPWDGRVSIDVERAPKHLRLRVPNWCAGATVNGQAAQAADGYVTVQPKDGERIELNLPMPARLTRAHPRVESCIGSVAIERGPLVYCLEEVDNTGVQDVTIDPAAPLSESWHGDLLGGVTTVVAQGTVHEPPEALYAPADQLPSAGERTTLTAVPYYAWANRAPGAMRVWIPTSAADPR
jgi:hypothetical protein